MTVGNLDEHLTLTLMKLADFIPYRLSKRERNCLWTMDMPIGGKVANLNCVDKHI